MLEDTKLVELPANPPRETNPSEEMALLEEATPEG